MARHSGMLLSRNPVTLAELTNYMKQSIIRSDILTDKIVGIILNSSAGPQGGGQDARNKAPHKSLAPLLA